MSGPTVRCLILAALAGLAGAGSLDAATYEVGPDQPLETPGAVPWESLSAGDEVRIHWRPEPYRDKWVICRRGTAEQPIRVVGIAGPEGQRPVIDGREATTRPELNFWSEVRGIIKIGGANRPADIMPAHIIVENLEVRSARPPFSFRGRDGETAYAKNAAAIFVEKGEHITIRNCALHDCGNGLFVASQSSDVLVDRCEVYDNGIEGSIYEHNSYTSAAGITFQFNHYGPLRTGCPGNNLKDRSAGLVVRYNWIEGGNRQLDLVDGGSLAGDPRYRSTHVYGNILVEREGDGNNQVVHYGGDSDRTATYRKGLLHFINNTIVSSRARTTLFRLSTGEERVMCRNNLVYLSEPGGALALMASDGTIELGRNWLPEGYQASFGRFNGQILGGESVLTGREPGLLDPARQDYRLAAGSPCIDAGEPLGSDDLPAGGALDQQYVPHGSSEPRPEVGSLDLGAFEFAGDRKAEAGSDPAPPRLPRDDLLLFRGPDGTPQPARTVEDWANRRREILAGMQEVMGRLPGEEKRCPLDVRVEEEVDCGTYVRRLITYASEPGSRVPAYLLIPKVLLQEEGRRAPAILCLHGTDNTVGHGVVVGLGGKPNRQYASELAERGYVTLAPNYPLLAKYQPDLKALGWESGTLKAVWDNMRGLDLLESLPYVAPGGFGAIGHSLGGHNSVYTAVFDDRIKAIVSSCGLDSFLDYYGGDEKNWFPEKGWTQTRYMPRLADYRGRLEEIPFDFHELIGALAPRHVFLSAPLGDSNFQAASVDRIAAAARPVFALFGHAERLQVEHPDCDHDFPPEMRERAYGLFDAVLR